MEEKKELTIKEAKGTIPNLKSYLRLLTQCIHTKLLAWSTETHMLAYSGRILRLQGQCGECTLHRCYEATLGEGSNHGNKSILTSQQASPAGFPLARLPAFRLQY